jgi:hypothetical protein
MAAEVRVVELAQRSDAVFEFRNAVQQIRSNLAAVGTPNIDSLSQALSAAAAFGIPSAYPMVRRAAGNGRLEALQTQGNTILEEMDIRLKRIQSHRSSSVC